MHFFQSGAGSGQPKGRHHSLQTDYHLVMWVVLRIIPYSDSGELTTEFAEKLSRSRWTEVVSVTPNQWKGIQDIQINWATKEYKKLSSGQLRHVLNVGLQDTRFETPRFRFRNDMTPRHNSKNDSGKET